MQKELEAAPPARPIQILGVNGTGLESHNDSVTEIGDLPWLQDTAEADVWAAWEVTWRDVVVLGPDNQAVETYSLTANDLSDPDNYAALLGLLRQTAEP